MVMECQVLSKEINIRHSQHLQRIKLPMCFKMWVRQMSWIFHCKIRWKSPKVITLGDFVNETPRHFWCRLPLFYNLFDVGSRRWNWKFREKHFWNPNPELLLQFSKMLFPEFHRRDPNYNLFDAGNNWLAFSVLDKSYARYSKSKCSWWLGRFSHH